MTDTYFSIEHILFYTLCILHELAHLIKKKNFDVQTHFLKKSLFKEQKTGKER